MRLRAKILHTRLPLGVAKDVQDDARRLREGEVAVLSDRKRKLHSERRLPALFQYGELHDLERLFLYRGLFDGGLREFFRPARDRCLGRPGRRNLGLHCPGCRGLRSRLLLDAQGGGAAGASRDHDDPEANHGGY